MAPATILVPTVGGSCAPILDSIRYHSPDLVHFICSADNAHRKGTYTVVDGEGSACGDGRPNIVTQAHLRKDQYKIHIVEDPDDLDACYTDLNAVLAGLKESYPRARILADYTGGTKSLSSALVVAALNQQVELVLIRGKRHDLIRVTDGMTYPHKVSIASVAVDRQFSLTHALEKERDYAAAVRTIETTTAQQAVPREHQEQLVDHLQLARAFDAWDKFDHIRAFVLFEALSKPVRTALRKNGYYDALLAIIHSRAAVDDAFKEEAEPLLSRPLEGAHGYEVVEDLLLNADRREQQGRYDDATARIYRAVELTGQLLLRREHDTNTASVPVAAIPEALREKYGIGEETESIQIGLKMSHELIAALDTDGFGALWDEWGGGCVTPCLCGTSPS